MKYLMNQIYLMKKKNLKVKIINSYDNFLYWCNVNIKRLYKNQRNFNNNITIDSSMKKFQLILMN